MLRYLRVTPRNFRQLQYLIHLWKVNLLFFLWISLEMHTTVYDRKIKPIDNYNSWRTKRHRKQCLDLKKKYDTAAVIRYRVRYCIVWHCYVAIMWHRVWMLFTSNWRSIKNPLGFRSQFSADTIKDW